MALIKLQGKTIIQGKTIFDGGPQAASPDSISGLQLWLDASDSNTLYDSTAGGSLVTTDGTAVARWEDKSGNGFHATQSTVNSQPTLQTAELNSKNVIRFDGLNDWYIADYEILMNAVSIFAVFKNNGLNQRLIDQRGTGLYGTTKGWHLKPRNTGPDGFAVDSADGAYLSKADAINSNYNICAAIYGAGVSNYYVNGTLKNTYTTGAGTVGNIETTKRIHIGANVNGQNTQIYNGDIGELIVYNSALPTTDRQAVEAYLTAKWGL